MRIFPYTAIIACVGAGFAMLVLITMPVLATDDVAEAEKMLQAKRLAEELVSRANERAWDAAMESSVGDEWRDIDCSQHREAAREARKKVFARYNVPTDENGKEDVWFFQSSQWKQRFERYTMKGTLEALRMQNRIYKEASEAAQPHHDLASSCFDESQRKYREVEWLYYKLRPKFIAEELERHIEQIITDAEKALLRTAVERLAI